ncbi:MAG: GNAT family N-acetyltransferase [Microbacterium sp.]
MILGFSFATADDAVAIRRIVEAAYRGTAGWTIESHLIGGQRTDLAEIDGIIAGPDGGILTLREGDEIVASCQLERWGDSAYFGMFAVDPAVQASGYGKRMLAEAERIVREDWELDSMRMTVIAQRDDLIAFYERRGFRRTGVTEPFPYGDERVGTPLVDGLHFVELVKPLSR